VTLLQILHDLAKCWNQCLRHPETEHKLWACHQQLRRQPLEETRDAFIFHHTRHNPETGFGVLEVAVLNSGLDDIKGCGNDQRCTGACDRSNKVLGPRR